MKTLTIILWVGFLAVLLPLRSAWADNQLSIIPKESDAPDKLKDLRFTSQALPYASLISSAEREKLMREGTLSVFKKVEVLACEYYIPFLLVKSGQQRIVFSFQDKVVGIRTIETYPLEDAYDFVVTSLRVNGIFFGSFLLSFLVFFSWLERSADGQGVILLGSICCCLIYWFGLSGLSEDLGKVFALILPFLLWLYLAIRLAAIIYSSRIRLVSLRRIQILA